MRQCRRSALSGERWQSWTAAPYAHFVSKIAPPAISFPVAAGLFSGKKTFLERLFSGKGVSAKPHFPEARFHGDHFLSRPFLEGYFPERLSTGLESPKESFPEQPEPEPEPERLLAEPPFAENPAPDRFSPTGSDLLYQAGR
jgi:hypothetical protein